MRNLIIIITAIVIILTSALICSAQSFETFIVLFENSQHYDKNNNLITQTEITTPVGQTFTFKGYAEAPKMTGFSTLYITQQQKQRNICKFSFVTKAHANEIPEEPTTSKIKITVGEFSFRGHNVIKTEITTKSGNTAIFKGYAEHQSGMTNIYTAKRGSSVVRVAFYPNGDKKLLD